MRTTDTAKHYVHKFWVRLAIFIGVGVAYLLDRTALDFTAQGAGLRLLTPANVLWVFMMCAILAHLNPKSGLTAGCMKQYADRFVPVEKECDRGRLRRHVKKQDRAALGVFIIWCSINLGFGLLYHVGILTVSELVLLCALYYVSDLVCVLFFCPFQYFMMHNRCCVTCRIFAWGAWMMTAPLLLVPHIYAIGLVLAGTLVLICWEVRYRRYPERFSEQTNELLQCGNCREKLCRYKVLPKKKSGQEGYL